MKIKYIVILSFFTFSICCCKTKGQSPEQKQIDSLINVLVKERWQWNQASIRLQQIGEPAVDKLLNVLEDKSLDGWTRRKAAMTLTHIKSENKIKPCLNIFTDETEDISLRANACRALANVNIGKYEELFFIMLITRIIVLK